jgi:hypothetical protein
MRRGRTQSVSSAWSRRGGPRSSGPACVLCMQSGTGGHVSVPGDGEPKDRGSARASPCGGGCRPRGTHGRGAGHAPETSGGPVGASRPATAQPASHDRTGRAQAGAWTGDGWTHGGRRRQERAWHPNQAAPGRGRLSRSPARARAPAGQPCARWGVPRRERRSHHGRDSTEPPSPCPVRTVAWEGGGREVSPYPDWASASAYKPQS